LTSIPWTGHKKGREEEEEEEEEESKADISSKEA